MTFDVALKEENNDFSAIFNEITVVNNNLPENVEKWYKTEFDIASVNQKRITFTNANNKSASIMPFVFSYTKENIANGTKNQIIVSFSFVSSFTDVDATEEYTVFSNSPKDVSDITNTTLLVSYEGEFLETTLEEIAEMIKTALPEDTIVNYSTICNTGVGGSNVMKYGVRTEEVYVETTDLDTSNAIWEEIEPLLALVSKIAIEFKEVDIETKEGELIYE